jgi:serine/threonine protein kinase
MGVVYEAIQLNLSRRVAVKILSDELAARPEFVHRFQREVARRNFLQLSTTP